MSALDMLDAFIGLIAVYLTLSLIVTAIGDGIVQRFGLRGRVLASAIARLTDEAFAERLLTHARIMALRKHDDRMPSKIHADIFAFVLLDTLLDGQYGDIRSNSAALDRRLLNATCEAQDWKKSLHQFWKRSDGDPEAFEALIRTWFNDSMDRSKGWFKRDLAPWLVGVGFLLAAALNADSIHMFETLMRDSDARAQQVALAQALIKEGEENFAPCDPEDDDANPADCQKAREDFIKNTAPMVTIVGWEETTPVYVALVEPALAALNDFFGDAPSDAAEPEAPGEDDASATTDDAADTPAPKAQEPASEQAETASAAEATPEEAGAPAAGAAGTAGAAVSTTENTDPSDELSGPERFLIILQAVIGWLITGVALSLGAPFWFNLLQRLINARAALRGAFGGEETNETPVRAAGEAPAEGLLTRMEPSRFSADDLAKLTSFHHEVLGFDEVNILWCARISSLAYETADVIAEQVTGWGGEHAFLEDGRHGTQCLFVRMPKFAILAFRGTEVDRVEDVMTDLLLLQRRPSWHDDGPVRVHTGFERALASNWSAIEALMAPASAAAEPVPLWVTGHSLGGALAVMAAERLAGAAAPVQIGGLFTFGQPRVGDDAYAARVDRLLGDRYYRSVNNRDAVPLVPPPTLPEFTVPGTDVPAEVAYEHAGRVIYFNDVEQAVVDPKSWFLVLDKIPLAKSDLKAKLAEAAGDHSMQAYLRLYRQHIGIA